MSAHPPFLERKAGRELIHQPVLRALTVKRFVLWIADGCRGARQSRLLLLYHYMTSQEVEIKLRCQVDWFTFNVLNFK